MWRKEVADIEVYPDMFCYVGHDLDNEEKYEFLLCSDTGDIREFVMRMLDDIAMMGYNVKGYDGHVIEFIMSSTYRFDSMNNIAICGEIYQFSKELIQAEKKPWLKNPKVPYFDIYKLHHFDNKAKACSLKWIEFAMRMNNISDLPYPPDRPLGSIEKIREVVEYCHHDVKATKLFIEASDKEISLRKGLSDKYELDLYDANDPKIGSEIILKRISKKMNIPSWEIRKMRTWRKDGIPLKDVILPYVRFRTEEFNQLLDVYMAKTVFDTKGDLKHRQWYKNVPYDYGTGGLHACSKSGSYHADEQYMILDIDVVSYYPNIAIRSKQGPRHLGSSFCVVYEEVFEERKTFPKGTSENYGLKIALNGVFGKSNDVYSYLYDPKFTMFITVNGQLLLTMLAEDILLETSAELLQANTDGITVRILRSDLEKMRDCMSSWEQLTGLQLEEAEYRSMFIRDVNNYLAVTTDGECKFKGAFEIDKAWHKDHSHRIVPIAVARACINSVPPEQTIAEHMEKQEYDDLIINGEPCKGYGIYDLCGAVRAKGRAKYVAESKMGELSALSKTVRYYMSEEGIYLRKTLPMHENKLGHVEKMKQQFPDQMSIFDVVEDVKVDVDRISYVEAGYTVKIVNTITDDIYDDINFDHYVRASYKILDRL